MEQPKTDLEIAWGNFVDAVAKSLGLYKILDWIISKMNKLKK